MFSKDKVDDTIRTHREELRKEGPAKPTRKLKAIKYDLATPYSNDSDVASDEEFITLHSNDGPRLLEKDA